MRHQSARHSIRIIGLLAASVATVILLGCAGETAQDSQPPAEPVPPERTSAGSSSNDPAPSSESPSPSATASTPAPDPGGGDSPPQRARTARISAAMLPGFNAEWVWRQVSSTPRPSQNLPGVCMRSSLTAIGAVSEYQATFTGSRSREEMAAQLTAVFPDPVTAATASDVLMTWQKDCATYARVDLNKTRVTVSEPVDVPTDAGAGVAWLATYGPVVGDPHAVWFVAEGFVRDGDTLTYLVMQNAGQDYNYEPGQTPLELALRVAAERLVKSR